MNLVISFDREHNRLRVLEQRARCECFRKGTSSRSRTRYNSKSWVASNGFELASHGCPEIPSIPGGAGKLFVRGSYWSYDTNYVRFSNHWLLSDIDSYINNLIVAVNEYNEGELGGVIDE